MLAQWAQSPKLREANGNTAAADPLKSEVYTWGTSGIAWVYSINGQMVTATKVLLDVGGD